MCQHWGAGDPSASTQVHTGRGIWVRRLFWSLLKPLRMRCSTFSGLDKQVGAGEKKCTRPPNTQPTTWTSSALKTCLLGLTFGLFVSRLLLLSCLLAQAFPVEVFFQLTSWKDAFCSRGSVNKISFFFHAFSVVDLTPEFHSGYATGCLSCWHGGPCHFVNWSLHPSYPDPSNSPEEVERSQDRVT